MPDIAPPQGYNKVAEVISKDDSCAIFRRFNDCNVLTALHLQSEIAELRGYIEYISAREDSDTPTRNHSRSFSQLQESGGPRYEALRKMESLVCRYNDLLIQISTLSNMAAPSRSNFKQFRKWFTSGELVEADESLVYDSEDLSEYVHVGRQVPENDLFTTFIAEYCVRPFHKLIGERWKLGVPLDSHDDLRSYDNRKIDTASSVVATLISSTLPVVTIYVLYAVKDIEKRIGITIAFTAIFALALSIFSNAKRVEIFAATATFAAVEVVFIGTGLEDK